MIILDKGQIVNSGNVNDIFSDIDSLDSIGVRPPQVTAIASGLEKKGYHFKNLPVTLDGADATFSDWLSRSRP